MVGLGFSPVEGLLRLWDAKVHAFQEWLLSFFFASMGFLVPVRVLFTWQNFLLGLLYTVFAVLAKLVTGLFAKPLRHGWILGVSMIARGDLGFLLAAEAKQKRMISADTFVIVVWALVWTTLFSPILLSFALKPWLGSLQGTQELESDSVATDPAAPADANDEDTTSHSDNGL